MMENLEQRLQRRWAQRKGMMAKSKKATELDAMMFAYKMALADVTNTIPQLVEKLRR